MTFDPPLSPIHRLSGVMPALKSLVICPAPHGCVYDRSRSPVAQVIIHLNDNHKWTREAIADWLETLDLDLSFDLEREPEPSEGSQGVPFFVYVNPDLYLDPPVKECKECGWEFYFAHQCEVQMITEEKMAMYSIHSPSKTFIVKNFIITNLTS